MAYVYAADIYCDECGDVIKKRIAYDCIHGAGMVEFVNFDGHDEMTYAERLDDIVDQLDALDESDYDSDDYPKGCPDDYEADHPDHCGSGSDCINAIDLDDGTCIGDMICNSLTSDGIEYVKEAVREGGEVAEFWREYYYWIDYRKECAICGYEGGEEDFDGDLCYDCVRCTEECKGDENEEFHG